MPHQIRVRTKLLSCFALFLVLLGTMGGIGYYAFHLKQKSASDLIASHDLLAEMQQYGQCSRSVLLQATLGLLLQNVEGAEEKQMEIASEIKAIEDKMTGKFTGEDAKLFDEVKGIYQRFIEDNHRWYQIDELRTEKNRI